MIILFFFWGGVGRYGFWDLDFPDTHYLFDLQLTDWFTVYTKVMRYVIRLEMLASYKQWKTGE